MRGDGRTVCQQFFSHNVAVQMPQPPSAVLGGDGHPDEPRVAQSGGEAGVPSGQPGVDGGPPAELIAIGDDKLPDVRRRAASSGSLAHSASNSVTGT